MVSRDVSSLSRQSKLVSAWFWKLWELVRFFQDVLLHFLNITVESLFFFSSDLPLILSWNLYLIFGKYYITTKLRSKRIFPFCGIVQRSCLRYLKSFRRWYSSHFNHSKMFVESKKPVVGLWSTLYNLNLTCPYIYAIRKFYFVFYIYLSLRCCISLIHKHEVNYLFITIINFYFKLKWTVIYC